ncbi:MAG: hypothetical protein VKP62_11695 [Candidatus Sericytochromatia bacterium]|nr:hypothetical protein [Candidatus Sericytochromatia bacterium]
MPRRVCVATCALVLALSFFGRSARASDDPAWQEIRSDYRSAHYESALQRLRQLVEIRPGDREAHYYIALVTWRLGQYAESAVAWHRVQELDPQGPFGRDAEMWLASFGDVAAGRLPLPGSNDRLSPPPSPPPLESDPRAGLPRATPSLGVTLASPSPSAQVVPPRSGPQAPAMARSAPPVVASPSLESPRGVARPLGKFAPLLPGSPLPAGSSSPAPSLRMSAPPPPSDSSPTTSPGSPPASVAASSLPSAARVALPSAAPTAAFSRPQPASPTPTSPPVPVSAALPPAGPAGASAGGLVLPPEPLLSAPNPRRVIRATATPPPRTPWLAAQPASSGTRPRARNARPGYFKGMDGTFEFVPPVGFILLDEGDDHGEFRALFGPPPAAGDRRTSEQPPTLLMVWREVPELERYRADQRAARARQFLMLEAATYGPGARVEARFGVQTVKVAQRQGSWAADTWLFFQASRLYAITYGGEALALPGHVGAVNRSLGTLIFNP